MKSTNQTSTINVNVDTLINYISTKTNWGSSTLISSVLTMQHSSTGINRDKVLSLLAKQSSWGKKQLTAALQLLITTEQEQQPAEHTTTLQHTSKTLNEYEAIALYISKGKLFVTESHIIIYGKTATRKYAHDIKSKSPIQIKNQLIEYSADIKVITKLFSARFKRVA